MSLLTEKNALAPATEDVLIGLLTLSHPSLTEPIRISTDTTEWLMDDEQTGRPIYCTKHQGETYIAYPYNFIHPTINTDGTVTPGKIVIDNVDRSLTRAVEMVHDYLHVESRVVWKSSINTVDSYLPNLAITSIDVDAGSITGTIDIYTWLREMCPPVNAISMMMGNI